MRTRAPRDVEDLVLLACIAAGAVIGFSLTGGAAIGTAVGAAGGIAVLAAHRRRAAAGAKR